MAKNTKPPATKEELWEQQQFTNQGKIIYGAIERDHETGEVKADTKISMIPKEPKFIKVYLDCLLVFNDLSKSLNPILLELLQFMTYAGSDKHGGNMIYMNKALKAAVAKNTGVSEKRVEQAITGFVKAQIFRRVATSTYQVNPYLFARGDWREVQNIRATFDFANKEVKSSWENTKGEVVADGPDDDENF